MVTSSRTRSPSPWCGIGWPRTTPRRASCSTASRATSRRRRPSRRSSPRWTASSTSCSSWWSTTTRSYAGCRAAVPAASAARIWHVAFDPPTKDGVCDVCGGELFQRDDDREETIRHRLEVYQEQTAPLASFYADEGILVGLDATGPVEEVTERALAALRRFACRSRYVRIRLAAVLPRNQSRTQVRSKECGRSVSRRSRSSRGTSSR